MKRIWLIPAALTLTTASAMPLAMAEEFPPVKDAAVVQECSACHIVFPPQMLPARSWKALLGNLGSHFGEDATVADPDRQVIVDYLTAHAADGPATNGGGKYLRGIAATTTPLRITATPYWLRRHDEVSPARFKSPQVKSAANCAACHKGAAQGFFSEAEEEE